LHFFNEVRAEHYQSSPVKGKTVGSMSEELIRQLDMTRQRIMSHVPPPLTAKLTWPEALHAIPEEPSEQPSSSNPSATSVQTHTKEEVETAKETHSSSTSTSSSSSSTSSSPAPHSASFSASPVVDLGKMRDHFRREGRLEEETALQLISRAREIFRQQPNVLKLQLNTNSPASSNGLEKSQNKRSFDKVAVYGDIHGQFYDLVTLLESIEHPNSTL
jgi:hypothetical protein